MTMRSRNIIFASLAWLQLVISLLLAALIIWGYLSFNSSLTKFVRSLAESVDAISKVVIATAETIEAKKALLDNTQKTLNHTRTVINTLKDLAKNQAKLGPEYATGMKATSNLLGQVAAPLQNFGTQLQAISVPNIKIDGVKPVVTMTQPFSGQGKQLEQAAQDAKSVAATIAKVSDSIGQDGGKLSDEIIKTSDQAIAVVDEAAKSLTRLHDQDLPTAINNLKTTSANLRGVSKQIDTLPNVGLFILACVLLLALWCIVNSLGSLALASSNAFDKGASKVDSVIIR